MTFLEELLDHFENTPPEKLKKDWAKYDTEENNIGPTVDELLKTEIIIGVTGHRPPKEYMSYNLYDKKADKIKTVIKLFRKEYKDDLQ